MHLQGEYDISVWVIRHDLIIQNNNADTNVSEYLTISRGYSKDQYASKCVNMIQAYADMQAQTCLC